MNKDLKTFILWTGVAVAAFAINRAWGDDMARLIRPTSGRSPIPYSNPDGSFNV